MKHSLFAMLALLILTACASSPVVVTSPVPVEATPPIVVAPNTPGGSMPPVTPDGSVTNPTMVTMSPQPAIINPFSPVSGDETLKRSDVFLDSTQVLTLESYPVQIVLALKGNLPDPCHQLRVVIGQPDEQNRIDVDVYSVTDPDMFCVQVLAPLDASINLGSFPSGHYTVWVNGKQVGEFDA